MSRSGREALPDNREWSRGHLGWSGVVGWPSQVSGSLWKVFPDVREWSRGTPGCPGVVESLSRMSGSS